MANFATQGHVNGISIPALTLAGLAFLGQAQNGNGFLGGLLGGGNCNQQSALMAENAGLRAQKYSDEQDAKVYQATRSENEKLAAQLMAFITPLSNEAASNRERVAVLESQMKSNAEIASLREQLVRSELGAKIDTVAQTCGCGIAQLNNAVAGVQSTLGSITRTIIPTSAICPEVMPRWNSYTTPTNEAPATQQVSGNIRVQRG